MATSENKPCCLGDVIEGQNAGKVVQLKGDIPAYVTVPASSHDRHVGVFIFTDIFGWELPNNRRVADFLSTNGYTAILPDLFGGAPWKEGTDFSTFGTWIQNHLAPSKLPIVNASLEYLRENQKIKSFAVIGFCWGGGATQFCLTQTDLFQAGVSFYGTFDQREGLKNVFQPSGPILFIFGGADSFIPQAKVDEWERKLKENSKVPFEIKVYPGQPHGFAHRKKAASRGDDDDKAQESAMSSMIEWLNKYTKA